MAPKKLSESEKQEIIHLYSHPDESTSTLASRFGVSSSTISRVLKQGLSDDDYNNLVQQKRTGGIQPTQLSPTSSRQLSSEDTNQANIHGEQNGDAEPDVPSPKPKPTTKSSKAAAQASRDENIDGRSPQEAAGNLATRQSQDDDDSRFDADQESREPLRRRRRRSRTTASIDADDDVIQLPLTQFTDTSAIDDDDDENDEDEEAGFDNGQGRGDRPYRRRAVASPPGYSQGRDESDAFDEDDDETEDDGFGEVLDNELDEELDEELLGDDDDDDDFSDDDLDDDDDEDDDDEDDGLSDDDTLEPLHFSHDDLVQIYPFADANLPHTCYLVIDRSAELITRPLQEFGELGDLPSAELSENTLPVFDNHRVAKRFANRRTQRIVKIPDSRILRKTTPYLQSKGITRLLIDGQVYSLTE